MVYTGLVDNSVATCVDVGWFEVGDEELRAESDREEVGDSEPEEDAVSIHLPKEEELWSTAWLTTSPDLCGLPQRAKGRLCS